MNTINLNTVLHSLNVVSSSYEENAVNHKYIKISQTQEGSIQLSETVDRSERATMSQINDLAKKCLKYPKRYNETENLIKFANKFKELKDRFINKERGYLSSFWFWISGGNQQIKEANSVHKEAQTLIDKKVKPKNSDEVFDEVNNAAYFKIAKQLKEFLGKIESKHLVVPEAFIYKEYLIESTLPFKILRPKAQIGLYLENRERFNVAVREFTKFFCECTFDDITTKEPKYEHSLVNNIQRVLYDHIPLFIDRKDEQGKIGLIGLKSFSPNASPLNASYFKTLVTLFPLHLDIIMEEGAKYCKEIEEFRKELEIEKTNVLLFFKSCYEDHREFLINKNAALKNPSNITLENPSNITKISVDQKKQIINKISMKMKELHNDEKGSYFKILGKNTEETLQSFQEKVIPVLLERVFAFILWQLNENCSKKIDSYPELMMARTLEFDLSKTNLDKVINAEVKKFGKLFFNDEAFTLMFYETFAEFVFQALVDADVVSSYHPKWYGSTQALFC